MRAALSLQSLVARRRCLSGGQPRRFVSGLSLAMTDTFVSRHIGPRDKDVEAMLKVLPGNYATLDALADAAVPDAIKLTKVRDGSAAAAFFTRVEMLVGRLRACISLSHSLQCPRSTLPLLFLFPPARSRWTSASPCPRPRRWRRSRRCLARTSSPSRTTAAGA